MKPLVFLAFMIAASPLFGQSNIRDVDFRNFTYPAMCAGEEVENVTVKNGEFSKETKTEDYVDRFFFKVFDFSYGDLNGDGKEEAVVLSVCNTGGTGNFTEGFVYGLSGKKPVLLTRIGGGDRADGGLRRATVRDGLIVLEYNDPEENGGACCPLFIITTNLKLSGNKLITVGKDSRRPVFPEQRVSFARGTSSAEIKLTIPKAEGRSLLIGARAGQTVTVKVNTKRISASLDGDEQPDYSDTGFVVKLAKGGDRTIRLANYEDTAVDVVVTVSIK